MRKSIANCFCMILNDIGQEGFFNFTSATLKLGQKPPSGYKVSLEQSGSSDLIDI